MSLDPKPSRNDATKWASLCHIGALIGTCFGINWLIPLVAMFAFKDEPFVLDQATEVLNFQISMILWSIIAAVLCFTIVGIPVAIVLVIVLSIFGIICPIIGAVRSSNGVAYRYPLTFRLVK